MVQMYRRALALMLMTVLFQTLLFPVDGRPDSYSTILEPQDAGVEVLLNAPGLRFDLSVLDGLVSKGEATVPLPPWPLLGAEAYGPYLLRSSYDPDLGVVIAAEDFTEFLYSQGHDVPMGGVSVSIVVPGEKVFVKRNMTQYDVYMDGTTQFDGTLKEDLEGLGFTDVDIPADPPVSFMSFRYLDTELSLSNETLYGVDGTRQVLVLRVVVPEGALGPDLEGRIVSVIELLGGSRSLWDGASRSDFSLLHAMLRPASDIDVPSVDWKEAMGTELQRLVDIGLISGLDGEDAEAISALSEAGAYGFRSRVFYDNRTLDWRHYDSSGLPSPVTLPEDEFNIYGDERFPQGPGNDVPDRDWALYLAASAAALIITSFLALVLFQRIDRASKLNNARRMLIFNTIKQNPGIHFSALMKDLGLKPGVTSYHINRLEKEELIKSYQDGMYRRFYLYEAKVEMKVRLSDLQKLIIETVRAEPGISQVHISRLIGKSKVVINYHVRFLRDLGVLHLETEGRETHCFLTSQGAIIPTT